MSDTNTELAKAQRLVDLNIQYIAAVKAIQESKDSIQSVKTDVDATETKMITTFDELVQNLLATINKYRSLKDTVDPLGNAAVEFVDKYNDDLQVLATRWPAWWQTFELFRHYALSGRVPETADDILFGDSRATIFSDFVNYVKGCYDDESDLYLVARGYQSWCNVRKL